MTLYFLSFSTVTIVDLKHVFACCVETDWTHSRQFGDSYPIDIVQFMTCVQGIICPVFQIVVEIQNVSQCLNWKLNSMITRGFMLK